MLRSSNKQSDGQADSDVDAGTSSAMPPETLLDPIQTPAEVSIDPANYWCQIGPNSTVSRKGQELVQWRDVHQLSWATCLALWNKNGYSEEESIVLQNVWQLYRHYRVPYYKEKGVPYPRARIRVQ